MDLYEMRLKRLEADYAETILAGQRADERRLIDAACTGSSSTSNESNGYLPVTQVPPSLETPDLTTETPSRTEGAPLPRFVEPMSPADAELIKKHMSTIKLKHTPSWVSSVPDSRLLHLLSGIVERDST